jgi:DNA protecting protein DprA
MTSEERAAWAVLAAVDGLGPVGFNALLRRVGSGTAVLAEAASPGGIERLVATPIGEPTMDGPTRLLGLVVAKAIAEATQRAAITLARIDEVGLQVVTTADPAYPRRLASIDMPPHVLFVLGEPAVLEARSPVAVVGTRRATDPGRAFAARLAASLVSVGSTVVSGLATGIDGAAHAATIHAGGTTVAVIGSGHAALFPRVHRGLARSIVASGGAIASELAPDVRPTRGTFPRRNRVISGLADATVVVEAPARSGALITASWALEQGRECSSCPGRSIRRLRPVVSRSCANSQAVPGSSHPAAHRGPGPDRPSQPKEGRTPPPPLPRSVVGRRIGRERPRRAAGEPLPYGLAGGERFIL